MRLSLRSYPLQGWAIALSSLVTLLAPTLLLSPVQAEPSLLQFTPKPVLLAQSRPEIKLNLSASKKLVIRDRQGQNQISWQVLKNGASVQPGDLVRYSLSGKNNGQGIAKNLVLNQPIPASMSYVEGSVQANGSSPSFSIDQGKTFSPRPMLKIRQADGSIVERPAPPERYTHIRWTFNQGVQPQALITVSYDVRVK